MVGRTHHEHSATARTVRHRKRPCAEMVSTERHPVQTGNASTRRQTRNHRQLRTAVLLKPHGRNRFHHSRKRILARIHARRLDPPQCQGLRRRNNATTRFQVEVDGMANEGMSRNRRRRSIYQSRNGSGRTTSRSTKTTFGETTESPDGRTQ